MLYILQTDRLTKAIGGKNLVTNVSMHVKKGEIYGFLGPNGAGKTTVMKMLTNLWKPTDGSIELFGQKLTPTSYEVLKRMGRKRKPCSPLRVHGILPFRKHRERSGDVKSGRCREKTGT